MKCIKLLDKGNITGNTEIDVQINSHLIFF